MVLKITPKQRVKINALVRRTSCNCRKGNCLLLDDGEEAKCVQLISRYGIYSLATSERRIKMIDKAIEELFEANISGKVSDERFVKMTDNYEKEQKELLELVADGNKKLQDAEQNKVDLKLLMKALRDYTDIRQLTPEIVNALIRRIEVHSKDKKTKKVKEDIYFTAVGLFTPPTEQELQMAMEEIRRNPQQFGIPA